MTTLRDRISTLTGFYFSKEVPLSETFKRLSVEGRFDLKAVVNILSVVCDYLEEKEDSQG